METDYDVAIIGGGISSCVFVSNYIKNGFNGKIAIIENGNERPKKPIRKLHNQKFREIGNFLFKIKKNNKIVILPIISLKDITLSGLIVSKEIFKAAKADPHITTRQKSIA